MRVRRGECSGLIRHAAQPRSRPAPRSPAARLGVLGRLRLSSRPPVGVPVGVPLGPVPSLRRCESPTALGVQPQQRSKPASSSGWCPWARSCRSPPPRSSCSDSPVRIGGNAAPPHRRHGQALDVQLQAEAATVEQTNLPVGPVDPAPDLLVAETDGVMVRYQDGWHEVKLGVVGGWNPDLPQEQRHLRAQSYVAARADVHAWGRRWGAEVARRGGLEEVAYTGSGISPGIATLRRVLVLGDGARWIWNAAAEQFGDRIEIVDWYHATEHVWMVARAVYGDGSAVAENWATESLTVLRAHGASGVLERLPRSRARDGRGARDGRYPTRVLPDESSADGLSRVPVGGVPDRVGRGGVERQARHPAADEACPGCRWSDRGGQALAVLCAQHATAHATVA